MSIELTITKELHLIIEQKVSAKLQILAGRLSELEKLVAMGQAGTPRQLQQEALEPAEYAANLFQVPEEPAQQAALLEPAYVMTDPHGRQVPLAGKPKAIFDAIQKVQAGLETKVQEGRNIQPELDAIAKGKDALARLGAVPAGSFQGLEAEFL
jgi:hypothetical protein